MVQLNIEGIKHVLPVFLFILCFFFLLVSGGMICCSGFYSFSLVFLGYVLKFMGLILVSFLQSN